MINAPALMFTVILRCQPLINSIMPNTNFPYHPDDLSAFIETVGMFVISLKDGSIVSHNPDDLEAFHNWLIQHDIRDINKSLQN